MFIILFFNGHMELPKIIILRVKDFRMVVLSIKMHFGKSQGGEH